MKSKTEEKITRKKRLEGTVVSNKMTNAVVVSVSRKRPHPKYGKIVSSVKKYYARVQEPMNVGDVVVIEESKPLSKLIRWVVVERK